MVYSPRSTILFPQQAWWK